MNTKNFVVYFQKIIMKTSPPTKICSWILAIEGHNYFLIQWKKVFELNYDFI